MGCLHRGVNVRLKVGQLETGLRGRIVMKRTKAHEKKKLTIVNDESGDRRGSISLLVPAEGRKKDFKEMWDKLKKTAVVGEEAALQG